MGWKLADLSPELRKEVMGKLALKNPPAINAALQTKPEPVVKLPKPRMNATERELKAILDHRYSVVRFEAIRLELATKVHYTPDFFCTSIIEATGHSTATFVECKGPFMRPDSWMKLKMAARIYPMFSFILAQKGRDGLWTETTVRP